MNVITYLINYFFPTKQMLSTLIASPIATTISPMLVSYMIGPVYTTPSIINATTYVIIRPISDITYMGWTWITEPQPPTYIELMPMKKKIQFEDDFEMINT